MRMFVFLRKKENVFRVLLCLYFGYLLLSRVIYLNADSPAHWLDIEEKSSAYNARNKVLFDDSSSGGKNYELMIASPLPAVISYLSFLLLGVSMFSLRLPYALLSVLAIFIFYKVLKKEMNLFVAFLGIVLFGSSYFILLWNRSAVVENLFILFTGVSLFFFQDYEENEKDGSIFLFGLFSALNISVKYSGAYFLVVSTAAAVMLFFKKGRSFSARIRSGAYYAAGVALSLILPVAALLLRRSDGELETLKWLCSVQAGNEKNFIENIKIIYPLFFMKHFPLIAWAALTGLFSMLFLRLQKLTRTDAFVLLWLILGSVITLPSALTLKRLIFLLIPLVYIAVKGGYGMWHYLRESNRVRDCGIGGSFDRRKGGLLFAGKMLLGCGLIILLSWAAKYALMEHDEPWHPYIFLFSFSTFLTKPMAAYAKPISTFILLALTVLPVVGAVSSFAITRDFYQAQGALKRWLVALLFVFLTTASVLSIISNEISNANLLFHPQNLEYKSFERSREFGRIVKNATVIGSEDAFRMLGFENRCKFIFNHAAPINGRHFFNRDIDDIILRRDIRYFCLFVSDSGVYVDAFLPSFEKIKSAYPDVVLLKSYFFENSLYLLFDKYPFKGP